MDFKSLLNKIDSIDAPVATPKAPTLPAAVKLNEDAELRVLAGTSSILEEAKKMKKEEKVEEAEKTATTWTDKSGKQHPATRVKGDKYTGKEAEKEEKAKEKVDEAEKKATTWTDMKGNKHPATQVKGDKYTGKEAEKEEKKKEKTEESIEVNKFKSKFMQMVEEAKKAEKKTVKGKKAEEKMDESAKPDFLDIDNDKNKKESMKKAAADKKKAGGSDKDAKKGMSDKQAKYFGKKKSVKESVFEADQEGPADLLAAVEEEMNNPGSSVDNLRDVLNATFGADRSPEFKKARAVIGKYLDLVDNAEMGSEEDGIAPMRGGNIARHIRDYDLTDYLAHASSMLDKVVAGAMGESYKSKKKTVKESVERTMSFRDMVKLVQESGGQQAIDPKDKELFNWATRVAKSKLGEGIKAEVYAGLIYERMGGVFEMYDVLSEDQK